MSTWVIISWVLVALITGINVIIFLKLKDASEQMMKLVFPDAKNMGEAMARMQGMMQGMRGMGGMGRGGKRGGGPFMSGPGRGAGGQNMDAQLKQAMEMLKRMQQPK
jgi:hypothetical protein